MQHDGPSWQQLSPRAIRVMEMLCAGCHNREIALEIGISLRTVKAYTARAYSRFGINSGDKRVKLAVQLYREDLADAAADESRTIAGHRDEEPRTSRSHAYYGTLD